VQAHTPPSTISLRQRPTCTNVNFHRAPHSHSPHTLDNPSLLRPISNCLPSSHLYALKPSALFVFLPNDDGVFDDNQAGKTLYRPTRASSTSPPFRPCHDDAQQPRPTQVKTRASKDTTHCPIVGLLCVSLGRVMVARVLLYILHA
jgi:hypothetical protein